MAIEDLIVQSGAINARNITSGFFGTPESRRNERLDKFNMDSSQRADRRAKEAHELKLEKNEREKQKELRQVKIDDMALKQTKQSYDAAVAKGNVDEWTQSQKVMDQRIGAAYELKTIREQRNYLEQHKTEILEAGNDEEDEAFGQLLQSGDDQFKEMFTAAAMSRKPIRDQIKDLEKQRVKAKSEGKDFIMKSGDSSQMYKMAVGYYGGFVDEDGNYRMLDPKTASKAGLLNKESSVIYNENEGRVSHAQANYMALKRLGLEAGVTSVNGKDYIVMGEEEGEDGRTRTRVRDPDTGKEFLLKPKAEK